MGTWRRIEQTIQTDIVKTKKYYTTRGGKENFYM